MKISFSWQGISTKDFDQFAKQYSGEKTFLQSGIFGNFRESLGENIFHIGIFEAQKLIGICLIQKIDTRLKTFLHCPHGPILDENFQGAWQFFLDQYKDFGRRQKCDFVRFSPLIDKASKNFAKILSKKHYRPSPIHLVNPEHTLVLDITPDEEKILAQMRKNTRYEVRRAERENLTVKKGNSSKDLDVFWQLHKSTFQRKGFVPFAYKNTQQQIKNFRENLQIISIFDKNTPLSSAIILFDETSGYYHQGASIISKKPASHLGLWEAIREAKSRKCQVFNFWGIVEKEQTRHPWFGLSQFKRGFGGIEKRYFHCHDAPLTSKYWINSLLEKWRKWRRGY